MEQKNGLTLLELLMIIVTLLFLLAIIVPPIGMSKKTRDRVVCSSNLSGIGAAIMIYSNDYDGNYPQLPGSGPWSKELGFAFDTEKPDFLETGQQDHTGRTISASWYLLVREADVSPKSLICPASGQQEFDGKNPKVLDIVDLWDFGANPYPHVSYSMHNPYGKYPAKDSHPASFAVAADMNPWMVNGDFIPAGKGDVPPQIITLTNNPPWKLGNSINHRQKSTKGEGQNVLYADGHSAYETQPNVGTNNDNIYTYWSTDKEPTKQDIRGGTAPTGRTADNDAKSEEDSFLAI